MPDDLRPDDLRPDDLRPDDLRPDLWLPQESESAAVDMLVQQVLPGVRSRWAGQALAEPLLAFRSVAALLALEQRSRRQRPSYRAADLHGTWRLALVSQRRVVPKARAASPPSGLKSSPPVEPKPVTGVSTGGSTGVSTGVSTGQFMPAWLRLTLTYRAAQLEERASLGLPEASQGEPEALSQETWGWVENQVSWGPIQLRLTGPTRFLERRNLLVFDFTRLYLRLGGQTFWDGPLPQGRKREAQFGERLGQLSVKNQAFFHHFWIHPEAIAARGRSGGIALWVKLDR